MDDNKVNLILSIDAVRAPLTGVGRYAWELARRMENHPDLEDIRFLSMGGWVKCLYNREALLTKQRHTPISRASKVAYKYLTTKAWAAQAYNAIIPKWTQHKLRRFESYLYHSTNFFVPPFAGRSLATIHDLSNYRYPETHTKGRRKLFELQMEQTLKNVDHLITVSDAMRDEIIEFFSWPESRITAVHLGVDPGFQPRAKETLEPVMRVYGLNVKKYVLCVSTLEPRKMIGSLLAAYEMLPATIRNTYPLVLAGDSGWLSERLSADIERGRRAGWLHWLGYVPDNDLPSLYAGARAFCYPSIYEGFGLPVLEAMASGVPVLTSNRSALPETARGAAQLFDPEDVDGLSVAIQKVIEDDQWCSEAVELGLKAAAERTWEDCVAKTIGVYRQVLLA